MVVVMNLSAKAHAEYRIGVPGSGTYVELLSTNDRRYGGSTFDTHAHVHTEDVESFGWARSVVLALPPAAALVLAPERVTQVQRPGVVAGTHDHCIDDVSLAQGVGNEQVHPPVAVEIARGHAHRPRG